MAIRLRQTMGGGSQIEPQPQAGEGGAEVMGNAGQHGGPFRPAPLQALHHPVEAGGEAAHRRTPPGRQGERAELVETHLGQGLLQSPQGALHLQGEIEQTGTQATARQGQRQQQRIGRPARQRRQGGEQPHGLEGSSLRRGAFAWGSHPHPNPARTLEGRPHQGADAEAEAELPLQIERLTAQQGVRGAGGEQPPTGHPPGGQRLGMGSHRQPQAADLRQGGGGEPLQGHLRQQHLGGHIRPQLLLPLLHQAPTHQQLEQRQHQGAQTQGDQSVGQGPGGRLNVWSNGAR